MAPNPSESAVLASLQEKLFHWKTLSTAASTQLEQALHDWFAGYAIVFTSHKFRYQFTNLLTTPVNALQPNHLESPSTRWPCRALHRQKILRDMVATERIEWLGEASRRKVLLDDGHVIQEQVNSEKYQGTLVFVRHTDHDAG